MKTSLQHITLENFELTSGKKLDIQLSFQIFGQKLHSSPVVLVNHALTGNSNVSGEKGWWKTLIGQSKIIDTNRFTVLCFNIPGNGFDGNLIDDFEDFKTRDVTRIFLKGLDILQIQKLHTIIGGSLGGAIAWEMLALSPLLAERFIPIAADYKTTDWLHAQCTVQQFLLASQHDPLQKARIHAMLCYRNPQSLNERFKLEKTESQSLKSHEWLNFHGKILGERFSIASYKLMNQLLMTINADPEKLKHISADIHLVGVNTDLLFPNFEIEKCFENLRTAKDNVFYHQIKSTHGHDAFLMEYEQLNTILKSIYT